jgi:hypothetical protein
VIFHAEISDDYVTQFEARNANAAIAHVRAIAWAHSRSCICYLFIGQIRSGVKPIAAVTGDGLETWYI